MNKLMLSPLTLLAGKTSTNDKGDIRFNGKGSFREAYGDHTVREIQIMAFGKTAEKLGAVTIGSRLETSGEYRADTKTLNNGKKEYQNIFLIGKITRVGKPSEVNESEENQDAIAPAEKQAPATYRTKAVAPVYSQPSEPSDADIEDIPF